MKVLMLNGSPRKEGCTYTALTEIGKTLEAEGVEYEIVQIGREALHDCQACGACAKLGRCAFGDEDGVNEFVEKAKQADGFVFGSPVYYAHPTGAVLSFLDRVFYTGSSAFAHKPGAAVVSARRGGTVASYDVMNKYFGISQMLQVGSTYWNQVHGKCPEDVLQDEEGLQTMRNLARNMAWVVKSLQAAEDAGIEAPVAERGARTNFIR